MRAEHALRGTPSARGRRRARRNGSPCTRATMAKASSAIGAHLLDILASSFRFRTGRTCRQPTEAWAYQVPVVPCLWKTSGQPLGVIGQILQRDRAVLDEGDRLSVALHRHHDVEPGFANISRSADCKRRIHRHRPRRPQRLPRIAEGSPDSAMQSSPSSESSLRLVLLGVRLGELDQEQRVGIAAHEARPPWAGTAGMSRELRSWCGRPARPPPDASVDQMLGRESMASRRRWGNGRRRVPCAWEAGADPGSTPWRRRGFPPSQPEGGLGSAARYLSEHRCCSPRRGAAASESGPRSRQLRAARGQSCRPPVRGCPTRRFPGRNRRRRTRSGQACRQRGLPRSPAHCRACCRSAVTGRRSCCSPPCRRGWRGFRSRHRPESRGHGASGSRSVDRGPDPAPR